MGKVIPELNEKLSGIVFCVPVPNMSAVDLTCYLEKVSKYDDIKKVVKQAPEGPLKDILSYPKDQDVSCDFNLYTNPSSLDVGLALLSVTTL